MTGSPSIRSGPARVAADRLGDPRSRPSIAWVHAVSGEPRDRVAEILDESRAFLDTESRIRRSLRSGGRRFYAQFRAPLDLYALVRLVEPDHVVETGVSSGVSSAHILLALRRNGHGRLHSIDLPVRQAARRLRRGESPVSLPPGRRSGWAVPSHLKTGWDLREGASEELLPAVLRKLDSVGLFLHDDLHAEEHLTWQLSTLRPKLKPGSVVLADNTAWTGSAFPRFARSLGVLYYSRRGSDLLGLRVG